MLYYTEVDLSDLEVPDERALCIYISGCRSHCPGCHYPELRRTDYGDPLKENLRSLILLYLRYCTCVCFMGEGECTAQSRQELAEYSGFAHRLGLSTALYSGRDTGIENWMHCFDYIKLGSYVSALGPLSARSTNQKMFQKHGNGYIDITFRFWD